MKALWNSGTVFKIMPPIPPMISGGIQLIHTKLYLKKSRPGYFKTTWNNKFLAGVTLKIGPRWKMTQGHFSTDVWSIFNVENWPIPLFNDPPIG
jgi:hypothetical protein